MLGLTNSSCLQDNFHSLSGRVSSPNFHQENSLDGVVRRLKAHSRLSLSVPGVALSNLLLCNSRVHELPAQVVSTNHGRTSGDQESTPVF